VRRAVTPDFGSLAAVQYRLEGAFRAVHTRLRTHAESVAFFGGGAAEVCPLSSVLVASLSSLFRFNPVEVLPSGYIANPQR